jgi:hypothetical protein
LRSLPTDSGTALDIAANGRYARYVVIACKREPGRRVHTVASAQLAELTKTDPSEPVVNRDDMARGAGVGEQSCDARSLPRRPWAAARVVLLRSPRGSDDKIC